MTTQYLNHFEEQLGAMVWTLSGLIETETPTSHKAQLDELGQWMATWATDLNAYINVHQLTDVGNIIECKWNTESTAKPIVICCHMDTVHPIGTININPTRTIDDRLYGVGSYDMKAGITIAQTVIQELIKLEEFPNRPITLLLNG